MAAIPRIVSAEPGGRSGRRLRFNTLMPEEKAIRIPPRGTRGARQPWGGALAKVFQPLINMQISRYRRSKAPTAPVLMGFPTVVLTTVGARTAGEHSHIVGRCPAQDDGRLIVASADRAAA